MYEVANKKLRMMLKFTALYIIATATSSQKKFSACNAT
jgi:hypothetical protein